MNRKLAYTAVFTGGVVVGGVATYFAARKHFDEHYSQLATDEIATMRRYFAEKKEKLEREESYTEKLEKLGYWADTERPSPADLAAEQIELDESEELIAVNYEEEMTLLVEEDGSVHISSVDEMDRDFSAPHIVSQEEFDDEPDNTKIQVTYYEQDGILTDQRDYQIEDVSTVLGDFSPKNFGYMPDDPNVMLIRNPRLGADYEITLDKRSYAEVVLGFTQDQVDYLKKEE